jgi:hypothetical protein
MHIIKSKHQSRRANVGRNKKRSNLISERCKINQTARWKSVRCVWVKMRGGPECKHYHVANKSAVHTNANDFFVSMNNGRPF